MPQKGITGGVGVSGMGQYHSNKTAIKSVKADRKDYLHVFYCYDFCYIRA